MSSRLAFVASAIAVVALGAVLRTAWLRSDPPAHRPVGIIWHDEGAWTHNARNRALWGVWRTDEWNPVFVTPVFTALEYGAFRAVGVGTWQARVVPVLSGLAAVAGLMVGLSFLAGRRAALAGGALIATNYVFVMWNRAALIESTMVAFMVVSWAAYAMSERWTGFGVLAGVAAALAWFTKAAAACFVAAIVLDACWSWWAARSSGDARSARAAALTIVGVGGAALLAAAFFVAPYWNEYAFYNWQMSVTRKPEYSLRALVDRASWLPIVQGTFARTWPALVVGMIGLLAVALRWRDSRRANRLLVLWVILGLAELVVHDSGNERRYLMFVPPIIALAASYLSRRPAEDANHANRPRPIAEKGAVVAILLLVAYLVAGSGLRMILETQVMAGQLSGAVRAATVAAILITVMAMARWETVTTRLASWQPAPIATTALVVASVAWNVPDYVDWLRHRGELNYQASVALARSLPAGTFVQGKLANGLALESRLKPLFVGNQFGNYEDRLRRDDVRYVLTYDLPRIGYESSDGSGLIQGILDRYPRRRIVAVFEVDETPGADRAVLIEKMPTGSATE